MIYTERNVKSHRRAIYRILGIGAAVVAAVLFDHAGEFCEDKYNQSAKSVQRVQRGECRFSENALFERTSCRSFEAERDLWAPAGSLVHWQTVVARLDWTLHTMNGTQLGETRTALGKCPDYEFDRLGIGCRCNGCPSLPRTTIGPSGWWWTPNPYDEWHSSGNVAEWPRSQTCLCSDTCAPRAAELLHLYGTTPMSSGMIVDKFVGAKPGDQLSCWYDRYDANLVRFSVPSPLNFLMLQWLAGFCYWGCLLLAMWCLANAVGLAKPFASSMYKLHITLKPYAIRAAIASKACMATAMDAGMRKLRRLRQKSSPDTALILHSDIRGAPEAALVVVQSDIGRAQTGEIFTFDEPKFDPPSTPSAREELDFRSESDTANYYMVSEQDQNEETDSTQVKHQRADYPGDITCNADANSQEDQGRCNRPSEQEVKHMGPICSDTGFLKKKRALLKVPLLLPSLNQRANKPKKEKRQLSFKLGLGDRPGPCP